MTKIDRVNETIDLEVLEAEAAPVAYKHSGTIRIEGDGPDDASIEVTIDDDGDLEFRCCAITSRATEDIEIVSTFTVLNVRNPQAVIDALSDIR